MSVDPASLAEQRLAALITLNELAITAASTLDLDDLLDRSLAVLTRNLRFDRALVLLIDESRGVLTAGHSAGGTPEMSAAIEAFELGLDEVSSQLVQLATADGPLVFRDAHLDPDERNRAFAALLGVTTFLGTPLVTKGRSIGVLAVDNGLTGRDVEPSDGPLLYTIGGLVAAGVENARLVAELERRVADRTADLVEARAVAEAATEAKSRFLSNVSHELRTPLTSVVGFSKLIDKRLSEVVFPVVPGGDPKVERAMRQVSQNLGIIVEEGERLTTLINDTLDLAKIEAGRMDWRDEPVAMGEVVARATAATSSLLAADDGPRLVVDVAEGLPLVRGDRDRLLQVVINLISNAVKFTPRGTITVAAQPDPEGIRVSVADTGVGIAPEDQAKVFEPFGQATDGLTDKPRGTGLGLPICREIVERHGGRLWLDSALGTGSTFLFTLPAADASLAAPARPSPSEPASPPPGPGAP